MHDFRRMDGFDAGHLDLRLIILRNRRDHARAMLAEIYSWFTEGFDTADPKETKALLDELALSRMEKYRSLIDLSSPRKPRARLDCDSAGLDRRTFAIALRRQKGFRTCHCRSAASLTYCDCWGLCSGGFGHVDPQS
jgi:hypothetical protein